MRRREHSTAGLSADTTVTVMDEVGAGGGNGKRESNTEVEGCLVAKMMDRSFSLLSLYYLLEMSLSRNVSHMFVDTRRNDKRGYLL